MAAIAIVAAVATLSFVIDAASFFIVRRELQNAADAAALAAARDLDPPTPANETIARTTARRYVEQNAPNAEKLCRHEVQFDYAGLDVEFGFRSLTGSGNSPLVRVTVHCNADYTFGRIMTGLSRRSIAAYATAVLAMWDTEPPLPPPNRLLDYVNEFPLRTHPLTSRLVQDI